MSVEVVSVEKGARERPAWVLLSAEARERGFKTTRSFRTWCKGNGIAVKKTGRKEWLQPADVDAVLRGAVAPSAPANTVVRSLVDRFTRRAG